MFGRPTYAAGEAARSRRSAVSSAIGRGIYVSDADFPAKRIARYPRSSSCLRSWAFNGCDVADEMISGLKRLQTALLAGLPAAA